LLSGHLASGFPGAVRQGRFVSVGFSPLDDLNIVSSD
jgi:hypothetical protein